MTLKEIIHIIKYLVVACSVWSRSGKKVWKMKIFPHHVKSQGIFGLNQLNWKKAYKSQGKVREFQNFLKTEMAMAVFLIFRNINLQNWPHSFGK